MNKMTINDRPLVSVIVPSFNHGPFLAERLHSVFAQDYQRFEVIILDDASEDNSQSIIKVYSGHPAVKKIVFNERNSGSTFHQWDLGLRHCEGEFVWIAESDDICEQTFLSSMVEGFTQQGTAVIGFCQSYDIDESGKIRGDYFKQHSSDDSEKWSNDYFMKGIDFIDFAMIRGNSIPNVSAVLFKRLVLTQNVHSASGMRYVGDWMIYVHLLLTGDIFFKSAPLNRFRTHSSTTRTTKSIEDQVTAYREVLKILEHLKSCREVTVPPVEKEILKIYKVIDQLHSFEAVLSDTLIKNGEKSVVIYGAGGMGTYTAIVCRNLGVQVACFVDRKYKAGIFEEHMGQKVVPITHLKSEYSEQPILIASVVFYEEIFQSLSDLGVSHRVLNDAARC